MFSSGSPRLPVNLKAALVLCSVLCRGPGLPPPWDKSPCALGRAGCRRQPGYTAPSGRTGGLGTTRAESSAQAARLAAPSGSALLCEHAGESTCMPLASPRFCLVNVLGIGKRESRERKSPFVHFAVHIFHIECLALSLLLSTCPYYAAIRKAVK